ncbi:hypothetical protein DI272_34965 [Streptomyces sp. Act143]|uniref:DUF6578 domain-containing protein n=1 Tax=Streptomyces sp. Act143 TaxID=2200760 RepID=UPI000D68094E|nr:DUF6578 domain-containing protein [Streptomyces sp. Act143]PWI18766.1 hypothetical protein DI272_34965 [Streptomyces sp. Act143]
MGLWHVYYEGRQMECCGPAVSVGDEVSRPLLLCDAEDVLGGGWYDQLTQVSGLSSAVREASGLPADAPPGAETADLDTASLAALLERFSTVHRPPH